MNLGCSVSPLLMPVLALALTFAIAFMVFVVRLQVGAVLTLPFVVLPTFAAFASARIRKGSLLATARVLISRAIGCF